MVHENLIQDVGCGVQGVGFGVWGVGFGVWGVGFRSWGVEVGVQSSGFRVQGSRLKVSGFRVQGLGCGVWGSRCWVQGSGPLAPSGSRRGSAGAGTRSKSHSPTEHQLPPCPRFARPAKAKIVIRTSPTSTGEIFSIRWIPRPR